jgi:predicted nucleic acid-binding Zn ribbon protein
MDGINFCPSCGKNVSPGTTHCPSCGKLLNGPEGGRKDAAAEVVKKEDRTNIAAVLILLYSVPLIFIGAYIYANADMVSEMAFEFYKDTPFYSTIADNYTIESFAGLIRSAALATIFGAVVGVVSAILAFMRRFWMLTILLCLISAGIAILSFIGLIMGLIAFWLLLKARPAFKD